jgi:hypothetical protein
LDNYGGNWRWRDGYYVRARADHVYVQGRWVSSGGHYRYKQGHWVRRDRRTSVRETWPRGHGGRR